MDQASIQRAAGNATCGPPTCIELDASQHHHPHQVHQQHGQGEQDE
jgi:hypothetical protein